MFLNEFFLFFSNKIPTKFIQISAFSKSFLSLFSSNIFDENKLRKLFENAEICINLVGILFEKNKKNSFKNIHTIFPLLLSRLSKEFNLKHFIHLSSLGINEAVDSKYAMSKLEGEKNILDNFPLSTILRPSLVYSVDDNFTTNMMSLLSILPFFPLYYEGKTKFTPIHVSEMADIILKIVDRNICSEVIECVGPDVITFREIIEKLLILIDKKKILIPLPTIIAKINAYLLEKLPKPLITMDQLKLLKYDSILTRENKSNLDLGIKSELKFEDEVKKYAYMWKKGGEYSK